MANYLTVDDALEMLLAGASVTTRLEATATAAAIGRICAEDVRSPVDVPPAANSAMDGYAVRLRDVAEPNDSVLPIGQRITAGRVPEPLVAGTAARIFTGAALPAGADTVVKQEDAITVPGGVRFTIRPRLGDHVRRKGQDIGNGDVVVTRGTRLGARHLGLLASVGRAEVTTFGPLRIAVLSTGNELVEPPSALGAGQIYDSNRAMLLGLVRALGMEPIDAGHVADDPAAIESALARAAAEADCVISTGGVSVGEEDFVKAAVERLGRLDLWRLAIRPGKPLAFGRIGTTPFFGLPGNPVSSYVTLRIVAAPYLLKRQGADTDFPGHYFAPAGFDHPAAPARQYLRVRVTDSAQAAVAALYPNQSSGVLSSLAWANGLAEVEKDRPVRRGDRLKIHRLLG